MKKVIQMSVRGWHVSRDIVQPFRPPPKAGTRLVSIALTLTFRGALCPLPPVYASWHTVAPIRVHRGREQVAVGQRLPGSLREAPSPTSTPCDESQGHRLRGGLLVRPLACQKAARTAVIALLEAGSESQNTEGRNLL